MDERLDRPSFYERVHLAHPRGRGALCSVRSIEGVWLTKETRLVTCGICTRKMRAAEAAKAKAERGGGA